MSQPNSFRDREYSSYVDSPTRTNQSAVEVVATIVGGQNSTPVDVDQVEYTAVNTYSELLAVGSGVEMTIVQYTVPVAKKLKLSFCQASGSNIATYSVKQNGGVIAKSRTWFNSPMVVDFPFQSEKSRYDAVAGDVIEVSVIHSRPDVGDFEARIFGELIDE